MEENENKSTTNEEIVNQDASQEINKETEKTYTEKEVEEIRANLKKEYEESFDEKFNKRLGRVMSKQKQENATKDELINLLKEQTGAPDIESLLKTSYEQYGVERPKNINSEDEVKLGKLDAQEILALDIEEIQEEAERLAGLKRNAREEAAFMEIGKYLTDNQKKEIRKKELEDLGVADKNLLEDEKFKTYMSKFRDEIPLKEIYENYKLTQPKKDKPFNEGSVKDSGTVQNEVKDFYTYEESLKFTREDFNKNPRLYQAVKNSMSKWGKK